MYIGLSFDGRIFTTHAEHVRNVGNGIYLDSFNHIVVELPGTGDFVAHYGPTITSEECIRGKIRYIDNAYVTYYDSDYEPCLQGKVRDIGGVRIIYYGSSDGPCFQGKIRSVKNTPVTYFDSYSSQPGKIRSVGDIYLG